nr:QSGamide [Urechis unicinctus]
MQPILRTVLLLFFTALIATSISARSLSGYESVRTKRQLGDIYLAAHRADMSLAKQLQPNGCSQIGCGLIDFASSGKKKRSDDYKPYSEEEMRRAQLIHQVLQSLQLTSNDLSDQMSAQ